MKLSEALYPELLRQVAVGSGSSAGQAKAQDQEAQGRQEGWQEGAQMTVENTNCTGQLPCHQVGASAHYSDDARDNLAKVIARHMTFDALDAQGGWLNNHARCCALGAADEILQVYRVTDHGREIYVGALKETAIREYNALP